MPELPEVEITRRQLVPLVGGRTISSVETTGATNFFVTAPRVLQRALIGRQIVEVQRLGKYLLLHFENHNKLLLHLGMTGQLFCTGTKSPRLFLKDALNSLGDNASTLHFEPDCHTHLIVRFRDRGPSLYFRDVRRFGRVQLLKANQRSTRLEKLGIDALSVNAEAFYQMTRNRKRAIKSLLLEQSLIAGVGNIYADEALFMAGIRPTKKAATLTRRHSQNITDAIKEVMRLAIKKGGSSIASFVQPNGRDGDYQLESSVYARTGKPCRRCSTSIKRVVLGQRSTHYCPRCQR